jgi:hypothetical protein
MTSGWRTPIGASSAIVLLLRTTLLAAEAVRLAGEPLAAAEAEAKEALASIAQGAVAIDAAQAFTLSDGGVPLRVLPVRYAPRSPGELQNVDRCALVLLRAHAPARVVPTIGVGYTESLGCTGFEAIAFSDFDGDGRLDIALIQSTSAPPDRYLRTPVVLRKTVGGDFAVDEALTAALDEQGGIGSIAELRRAMAKRRAAPR